MAKVLGETRLDNELGFILQTLNKSEKTADDKHNWIKPFIRHLKELPPPEKWLIQDEKRVRRHRRTQLRARTLLKRHAPCRLSSTVIRWASRIRQRLELEAQHLRSTEIGNPRLGTDGASHLITLNELLGERVGRVEYSERDLRVAERVPREGILPGEVRERRRRLAVVGTLLRLAKLNRLSQLRECSVCGQWFVHRSRLYCPECKTTADRQKRKENEKRNLWC